MVPKRIFPHILLSFLLACSGVSTGVAAPGDLDASFGTAGQVATPLDNAYSFARRLALQSDGKIVVTGPVTIAPVDQKFAVLRYLPNGSLDPTFGGSGVVFTTIGTHSEAQDLAIQSDGKIIVAGTSSQASTYDDFAVARYLPDGTLDEDFGTDGVVTTTFGPAGSMEEARSVELYGDGRIVAAGKSNDDVALVRYLANGTLDPAFGTGGKVKINLGSSFDQIVNMALQPDGKIVATVYTGTANAFTLIRLTTTGSLDPSFGTAGKATFTLPIGSGGGYSLALLADGKILVGGSSDTTPGIVFGPPPGAEFALVRFNADGSIDSTFGSGGLVVSPTGPYDQVVESFALQDDGFIIAAGTSRDTPNSGFVLVRFQPDGTRDPSFGTGGRVDTTVPSSFRGEMAIVLQPDGDIVLGGHTIAADGSQAGLVRLARYEGGYSTALIEPATGAAAGHSFRVVFSLAEAAQGGSVELSFDDGSTVRTATLSAAQEGKGLHTFSFDPANPVGTSGGAIVSGGPIPDGTYTVTLSHRTANGMAGPSRSATGVIIDRVVPTIGGTFAPLTIVSGASGFGALPDYTSLAIAGDNIGVAGITQSPPASQRLVGTTTVTLTAKDAAGNAASTSFNVQVTDGTPPKVLPPGGPGFLPYFLTVEQGGTVAMPDFRTDANITDNVAVASVEQSPAPGSPVGEGTLSIVITARDAADNAGTWTFSRPVRVIGSTMLAAKNAEVPNPGNDPRLPEDAVWSVLGVPSISMGEDGANAGWLAKVKAPKAAAFQGIFFGPLREPALKLKAGDPIGDAASTPVAAVRFKSFREPVFAGDQFAVLAAAKGRGTGAGNDTGVWFHDSEDVIEVAREGANAPGTSAKFEAFTSLAMPVPDVVAFVATLTNKKIGLWMWTPADGLNLALCQGKPVDVEGTPVPVKSFRVLTTVKGATGHGHYDSEQAQLDVLLTLADGRTALGEVSPDATVSIPNVAGPDSRDLSIASFGMPSTSDGNSIVLVKLPPDPDRGITAANSVGIYEPFSALFMAMADDEAEDAEPAKFKSFLDPVCGTVFGGSVIHAFTATLKGAPASADTGIWSGLFSPNLIAREGDEPPGAAGTKWKAFTSLSVLNERGPMFLATLASGTIKVKPADDTGLWATDTTGALRLILREGDEIAPGKKLRSFDVLEAVAGSPGQRRAWTHGDASARIIYRAFFTDGSNAIVSTAVP